MKSPNSMVHPTPWRGIRAWMAGVVVLGMVVPVELHAEPMSPGKYKAPLKYAVRLPDYCGSQYFGRAGAQYQLPSRQLCGVRTNHFCGALVSLMQSQDEQSRVKRLNRLKHAEKEILYTQRGIADFPRCPLHPEVEAALTRVRATMRGVR